MAHALTAHEALTATVIGVCGVDRLDETSAALTALRRQAGVRTILISLGSDPQPPIDAHDDVITIRNLVPRYLNNAVGSLRLSSLPSIAWWRGGDADLLVDLAALVDRLILDADDPLAAWARVPQLARATLIADLRWTALTRWRSLIAQFFDVPDVSRSIGTFRSLEIAAGDRHAARLLAGWLGARLPEGGTLAVHISSAPAAAPIQSVRLAGSKYRLSLERAPATECIRTSIDSSEGEAVARFVPLGHRTRESLVADELRVRARDLAFEEALRASAELP
jgi:glucose-6-phosphate dehydrogenase assembly protein OpcA